MNDYFDRVATFNKPSPGKINVIYVDDKPPLTLPEGGSEGSIAMEENLQQLQNPSEYGNAGFVASNFDIMRAQSKNSLPIKEFPRTSIMQPESNDPQSNNSWNSYLNIESATSNPSSVSMSNVFSPHAHATNVANSMTNGGQSPNRNRRPSRFYTYEKKEAASATTQPVITDNKVTKSSKSQEFMKGEIDHENEPYGKLSKRPSILSSFLKRNSIKRGSRDSSRGFSPEQMNLIDDKVSVYKEPKTKSLINITDRSKQRKSKLLDRISLIAARGGAVDESKGENPAAIFKRVLKQVNPTSLQKAEKKIKRRYLMKIQRNFNAFLRAPLKVFSPEDYFSIFWYLITPIMICYDTFFTPLQGAFYMENRDYWTTSAIITPIFFSFDALINFRMAFYNQGVLVTNSREIVKHYLRGGFIEDSVTILTDIISVACHDTPLFFLKIICVIRLIKLWSIITRLEDFLIMSRVGNALLKMLKLWGTIIIVAHWLTCGFYTVAHVEENLGYGPTWVELNRLHDTDVTETYIAAFYWSITTMVSVGYGDIVPVTSAERVYTVIAMIISSALFGYSLNTVGEIIREMNREKDQRREKIRSVRKYMNQKNLGKGIQTRVKNYLQYMIDSRTLYKNDDEEFFTLLSQNLQDEIISEVNGKILAESRIFSINFTTKAASKLAKCMKEMFVQPEEIIFDEGSQEDLFLYFIVYGKVQLEYKVKKIKIIEKGASFGEIGFFSGMPRTARAKSLFFTNLYKLDREFTIEQLKSIPSDYEMFHFIKDNINLYNDYTQLQLECYFCGTLNHIGRSCSDAHFKPNREEVITDFMNKEKAKMKKFKRRSHERFNPRENLKELTSIAVMIQEDYNDYTLSDEDLSQDSLDNILERNLFLVPGAEMHDIKHRKIDRKRKSTRMSQNLLFEQLNNLNDIIGRRGSQMTSNLNQQDIPPQDPMVIKSNGEFIFFSIDKVENFELYYPQNNIIKIITEFERSRFERLLESRQGAAKALVIRNFGSMLKSNKGPHKSPLFYANLSKERIIQRGRKKTKVLQNVPMQRLKTLMQDAINDKKKTKKKKTKLYTTGFPGDFTSDTDDFYSRKESDSSVDAQGQITVLAKPGTLEDDEATITKSERMVERRQTNPSLFMNKLGSLTPKMMNKMTSDAGKLESRASSIDTPLRSPNFKDKDNKDSDHEKEKERSPPRASSHIPQDKNTMKNMLMEMLLERPPSSRRSSRRSDGGRRESRSVSKLDEMDKLIDKLEEKVDMSQLFQKMVERKLSKTLTAHFGN